VFAAFVALQSVWPLPLFLSTFGPTAWTVLDVMIVLMLLFAGLGFVFRAGVWLRLMNLVTGLGSFALSPLLVQRGSQSGQPWLVVLGILFVPAGVWCMWDAYRGRSYLLWWRRTVTFDELVGR
jgi:hypothetical protein